MEFKDLQKRGRHRRDGFFKAQVVARLHLGLNSRKDLCRELKISPSLLRRWLRWDYVRRVGRYLHHMDEEQKMKQEALRKRVSELEKQLELERLKSEGLEILLNIGKEEHGLDLRKKPGAKPSKG